MQIRQLREYAARRGWRIVSTVHEVRSGAKRSPQRELLLDAARRRELDVIVVWRLDRWGRSLADLVTTLKELSDLGVAFVSLTEAFDLTTPTGRAMAGMVAVFAEFEREIRRERVRRIPCPRTVLRSFARRATHGFVLAWIAVSARCSFQHGGISITGAVHSSWFRKWFGPSRGVWKRALQFFRWHPASKPTIKQHLAAIRMCFDWLVTGHAITVNPAAAVHGPKHTRRRGKTAVMSAAQARRLLESIGDADLRAVRDYAIFALMLGTAARVGAATKLRLADYFLDGEQWSLRLSEKGGNEHVLPATPGVRRAIDRYLERAGLRPEGSAPLFRPISRGGKLLEQPMTPNLVYTRVRQRARAAGLSGRLCCHTFRATSITRFRERGGTLEQAQLLAGHAQPQTTQLYDHSADEMTLADLMRIDL